MLSLATLLRVRLVSSVRGVHLSLQMALRVSGIGHRGDMSGRRLTLHSVIRRLRTYRVLGLRVAPIARACSDGAGMVERTRLRRRRH